MSPSSNIIIGGGLAGKVMSLCLRHQGIPSTILEKSSTGSYEDDGRVFALSNGSIRILKGIGLWDDLLPSVTPVKKIHVSIKGRFGSTLIDAKKEGVSELGCSVPIQKLNQALHEGVKSAKEITFIDSAEIMAFSDDSKDVLSIDVKHDGKQRKITPQLLIASDGMHSQIRNALNIKSAMIDYNQTALTFIFKATEPKKFMAFERFTTKGSIAVLPSGDNLYTAIWVLSTKQAALIQSQKINIEDELVTFFGKRLGSMKIIGPLFSYPLFQSSSEQIVKGNTVLIGSSALHLHPIAGQGYNLVLRDAAFLAETLGSIVAMEMSNDHIRNCLNEYVRWRKEDQLKVKRFTHFLASSFSVVKGFRGNLFAKSLLLFDLLPMAKSILSKHTMGLAGKTPKIMNSKY